MRTTLCGHGLSSERIFAIKIIKWAPPCRHQEQHGNLVANPILRWIHRPSRRHGLCLQECVEVGLPGSPDVVPMWVVLFIVIWIIKVAQSEVSRSLKVATQRMQGFRLQVSGLLGSPLRPGKADMGLLLQHLGCILHVSWSAKGLTQRRRSALIRTWRFHRLYIQSFDHGVSPSRKASRHSQ